MPRWSSSTVWSRACPTPTRASTWAWRTVLRCTTAKKLVFATGVRDVLPAIPGFAECWGISVLHCPYCHGYEVRDEATGVLGNGERGFRARAPDQQLDEGPDPVHERTFHVDGGTRGPSCAQHRIRIVETAVAELEHAGRATAERIHFADGSAASAIHTLYAMPAFEQHCTLPQQLGCVLTDEGYLKVDPQQRTSTVPGIYACGRQHHAPAHRGQRGGQRHHGRHDAEQGPRRRGILSHTRPP
jgi:thioredoxin reductase